MVLYELVPHKSYYQITFRDIPEDYILGGACLACAHTGPVNRFKVERRWGKDEDLRFVDSRLRCLNCGNGDHNRFTVFGRRLRVKKLPATVEDG